MNKQEQYVDKLKTQLNAWNAEVTKWEAKSRSAQADVRVEYDKQLATFRVQRDKALTQMHKVQAATGDVWVDFVRGADDAWAKMREAYDKAHSHFQK